MQDSVSSLAQSIPFFYPYLIAKRGPMVDDGFQKSVWLLETNFIKSHWILWDEIWSKEGIPSPYLFRSWGVQFHGMLGVHYWGVNPQPGQVVDTFAIEDKTDHTEDSQIGSQTTMPNSIPLRTLLMAILLRETYHKLLSIDIVLLQSWIKQLIMGQKTLCHL